MVGRGWWRLRSGSIRGDEGFLLVPLPRAEKAWMRHGGAGFLGCCMYAVDPEDANYRLVVHIRKHGILCGCGLLFYVHGLRSVAWWMLTLGMSFSCVLAGLGSRFWTLLEGARAFCSEVLRNCVDI